MCTIFSPLEAIVLDLYLCLQDCFINITKTATRCILTKMEETLLNMIYNAFINFTIRNIQYCRDL